MRVRERQCEEKIKAVEEILRQTEEDADKEILEMKTSYEEELKKERESTVKLRWAISFVKKGSTS